MTANVEAMVREAIRAYRSGKKAEARTLLEKAVELDQYHEQAWLWLSAVVESPDEQRTCLENVLFINPNNENAKQGLKMLPGSAGSAPAAKSVAPSATPPAVNPFTADVIADIDSSVEWEAPTTDTSSPSANPATKPEPSARDYDNWVAGLNLSSGASKSAGSGGAGAFVNPDEVFGPGFFDDEDEDDEPAPAVPAAPTAPAEEPSADDRLFGIELDDGPFSVSAFEMPETDSPSPTATSKPASSRSRVMSPAAESASASGAQFDLSGGGAFAGDDDFDAFALDEPDPSEYFQRIPTNIRANRLPGTVERVSPIVLLGLILLIVLNVGALVVLIGNLTR